MIIDHINIAAPYDLLEEVRNFYCDVLEVKNGFRLHYGINMTQLFFKDPAGTGLEVNFPGES